MMIMRANLGALGRISYYGRYWRHFVGPLETNATDR